MHHVENEFGIRTPKSAAKYEEILCNAVYWHAAYPCTARRARKDGLPGFLESCWSLAEVALVNIILMLASALVSGGLSVH